MSDGLTLNTDTTPAIAQADDSGQALVHRRWVRVCHWLVVASFLVLAVTGILILMVHPRLYWGEVGNDLVPALLELPISANHQPEGWTRTVTFDDLQSAPFSAERTYPIFNQNGWGRSLHFLAGWVFVITGLVYVLLGVLSGHARRNLVPRAGDVFSKALWADVRDHLRRNFAVAAGPPYNLLQRLSYTVVVFVLLPLMVVTGLTMAPAVTVAYPWLLDLFGGYQSARTVHFFGFALLIAFVVVHFVMVVLTGFRRQIRAMLLGS